jgi:5-aminopentanamidase
MAFDVDSGQLNAVLAPLASDTVTTIVGFTETTGTSELYNSAAVFHRGSVIGVYRKLHPAIRKSIYRAGERIPVFRVHGLTFGIVICNDSNHAEPARIMAGLGATAIFVPTNNGLPPEKADVVADARNADVARAAENSVWVIRADVAGRTGDLVSYGSSGVVDPDGTVLRSAQLLTEELLVVDLATAPREPRRGPNGVVMNKDSAGGHSAPSRVFRATSCPFPRRPSASTPAGRSTPWCRAYSPGSPVAFPGCPACLPSGRGPCRPARSPS